MAFLPLVGFWGYLKHFMRIFGLFLDIFGQFLHIFRLTMTNFAKKKSASISRIWINESGARKAENYLQVCLLIFLCADFFPNLLSGDHLNLCNFFSSIFCKVLQTCTKDFGKTLFFVNFSATYESKIKVLHIFPKQYDIIFRPKYLRSIRTCRLLLVTNHFGWWILFWWCCPS